MAAARTEPQALGALPEGEPRQCMFCGEAIANRGEAYWDHLQGKQACHEAYTAWLERLGEDRLGG